MTWAVIVPLALFLVGLLMVSLGWAMVEDDPAGALYLAKLRQDHEGPRSPASLAPRSESFAAELRALGLHRAAFLSGSGPVLSIVGAVLGVVSCAAVLTVG